MFDNFFSSLLEMEDLKKKDDPKGKTIVVVNLSLKVYPIGKTNVLFSEPSLCSTVVSDAIPKYTVNAGQSVLPRKRKAAVSEDLCLSIHNLRDVSLQNLRREVTNMKTIAEEKGNGYRYGFSKWSAFLKSNQIHIGATLFFKYVKALQLLILNKVVHKTTKKRGHA
ncbi:hypothetical protein Hdeb2414_s0011g00370801 [Helianthus debilis subsp. tardiflorus]